MTLETLAALIAAVSAFVAIVVALSARRDVAAFKAAAQKREAGRLALSQVMDAGNELMEVISAHRRSGRRDQVIDKSLGERLVAWDNDASSTVDRIDFAQHHRYHQELPRSADAKLILQERLDRLQEIQNRL